MPRPKKPGAPEPKKRSRKGCWPCKDRKIKCDEEHPSCNNCQKANITCDYSIRLNWEGRRTKRSHREALEVSRPNTFREHILFPLVQGVGGAHSDDAQLDRSSPRDFQPFSASGSGTESSPPAMFSPRLMRREDSEASKSESEPIPRDGLNGKAHMANRRFSEFILSPQMDGSLKPGVSSRLTRRRNSVQSAASIQRRHKRTRSEQLEVESQSSQAHFLTSPPSLTGGSNSPVSRYLPGLEFISLGSPITPAASSSYSESEPSFTARAAVGHPSPAGSATRRLTVNSLLSASPGPSGLVNECPLVLPQPSWDFNCFGTAGDQGFYRFYGYDLGQPDEDALNDDQNAISEVPHTLPWHPNRDADVLADESQLLQPPPAVWSGAAHQRTWQYYGTAVPIRIPLTLEPLPSKLRDNKMNMLYFHHFLDHTARVLVPYDDPQLNPFRTILPQMAVQNDHLLSLLLAYSASHRAQTLGHPEPRLRMAQWVGDIFPALRGALNDQEKIVSNVNLATAIMLASLEIICPTAFGYQIHWREHLNLARDLMKRRAAELEKLRSNSSEDEVCSFLWSWFAYLDVLGSLSRGIRSKDMRASWILDYGINNTAENQAEIDCILGFTNRCVYLLAQVAELARQCDLDRIGPNDEILPSREPSHEVEEWAAQLEHDLWQSLKQPTRSCTHSHMAMTASDRAEMVATNQAFHMAGLIYLHRRVLGKPSEHSDVQGPIRAIYDSMDQLRKGGTAETAFLFPLFIAGCESKDEKLRDIILERFRTAETSAMTQVSRARRLMQLAWQTGQPWEALSTTEFLG